MSTALPPNDLRRLLPIQISGVQHADALLAQGREIDATNHVIAAARARWTGRWATQRPRTLEALATALDVERFPRLEPVVAALCNSKADGAAAFVDYLRHRKLPDMSPDIIAPPSAAVYDSKPQRARSCFDLWCGTMATGDAELQKQLNNTIATMLDPVDVPSWHETSYPWVKLLFSAVHHGGIDDHTLCMLALLGLDYAEHSNVVSHLHEPAQPSIGGNHLLYHILSGLTMMLALPEFKRAPVLVDAMLQRLDDEMSKQVMPDGCMIEAAPGYQNCCLNLLGNLLSVCKQHGVNVHPRVRVAIEKMILTSIGWMKPDGRTPMFGDSQDDVFADVAWPIGKHFDMPELKWALSRGKEGQPPERTSMAFPCIGYYAMRTGWNLDDLCMVYDGGRMGQAHSHEDMLSFEMSAYGQPFIIDPGVYGYDQHWFREWSVLSQAHNTVIVDGIGQCRWRQDRELWYSHEPLRNPWQSYDKWDAIAATFNGPWEHTLQDAAVRRRIAFFKGDDEAPPFWWVTDLFTASGADSSIGGREHDVAQHFHFAVDVDVKAIDGGVIATGAGGQSVVLLCFHRGFEGKPVELPTVTLHRGEESPRAGWVSPRIGHVEPAWEVHFTARCMQSDQRDFLLIPSRKPFTALPRATYEGDRITLTIGDKQWALERPGIMPQPVQ